MLAAGKLRHESWRLAAWCPTQRPPRRAVVVPGGVGSIRSGRAMLGFHPAASCANVGEVVSEPMEFVMKKALVGGLALVALPVMAQAQSPSPGVYIGAEGGVN